MNKVLPLLLLILLAMQGCPIPEKYVVSIDIKKNGDFHTTFDGTVVCALLKKGKICLQKKQDLAPILNKFPFIKKVKYVGNCRYEIHCEKSGVLKSPNYLFDKALRIISITPSKMNNKNVVIISGMKLSSKDINILNEVKIAVNGTIKVNTNGKVLEHNAKESPMFFGMFGSYQWEIKNSCNPKPHMIIELN